MRSFVTALFIFTVLAAAAQPDTLNPDEDQILMRIELGEPSMLFTPLVLIDSLEKRACRYYYKDSLFTGAIKIPSGDSLYSVEAYTDGVATGEKLILQRNPSSIYFGLIYEAFPVKNTSLIRYIRYYSNGRRKATGFAYREKEHCDFTAFFGADDPPNCEFREYYPDGQLKSLYKSGSKGGYDGWKKTWYPNGQLQEQRQFNDGTPTGKWARYTQEGKRTEKLTFRNGKANGRWDAKRFRHHRVDLM